MKPQNLASRYAGPGLHIVKTFQETALTSHSPFHVDSHIQIAIGYGFSHYGPSKIDIGWLILHTTISNLIELKKSKPNENTKFTLLVRDTPTLYGCWMLAGAMSSRVEGRTLVQTVLWMLPHRIAAVI